MAHTIKTVYVIHHSHTDIGYTDLQERIIDTQADYIQTVLSLMEQPENAAFRWNCETLFCVEEFLKLPRNQNRMHFSVLYLKENWVFLLTTLILRIYWITVCTVNALPTGRNALPRMEPLCAPPWLLTSTAYPWAAGMPC